MSEPLETSKALQIYHASKAFLEIYRTYQLQQNSLPNEISKLEKELVLSKRTMDFYISEHQKKLDKLNDLKKNLEDGKVYLDRNKKLFEEFEELAGDGIRALANTVKKVYEEKELGKDT